MAKSKKNAQQENNVVRILVGHFYGWEQVIIIDSFLNS